MRLIRTPFYLFFVVSLLSAAVSNHEPVLQSEGAPYAPLDVSRKGQDPLIPLSISQRYELLGEFKGLVHMGLNRTSLDKWEGKEMADCDKPERPEEHWSARCEIITGQGNGYYYFFPNESRTASILQELDIRVHATDARLLDDFRRPVQEMFGQASFVEKPSVRARPTGLIRRWTNQEEVAELFIDHGVRPEGSIRFVWMRSPLVPTDHAGLPHQTGPNTDN